MRTVASIVSLAAYWFHTVTSLNMSMSLSVVSASEEEMVYAKVRLILYPVAACPSRGPIRLGVLVESTVWCDWFVEA